MSRRNISNSSRKTTSSNPFTGDEQPPGPFLRLVPARLQRQEIQGARGHPIRRAWRPTPATRKISIISTRSFLRPDAPTVWITSKRYFLRRGAVDNGIKVYSNAPKGDADAHNGEKVSTLDNGQYVIPSGPWALHVDKKKKGSPPGPRRGRPRPYVPEKCR